MWRSLTALSLIAVLSTCFAGCSLVQPSELNVRHELTPQTRLKLVKDAEAFLVECETSVPALDPKQLKAGQHIQILTGGTPMTDFPEFIVLPTKMAGSVKEVGPDRVVLQDVLMVNESRSQQGVPIVSKVPYVSRLFKNTGVGRVSTAIPGELTIELSRILHASELTAEEFEAMQKNGMPERIGVDFDFNIEDGRSAITQR
ncbi:MAG: hypothetical protein O2856_10570 [Planctomycetota bacterium]|nr:hypothetical protein [Planctomycetota bacterium]